MSRAPGKGVRAIFLGPILVVPAKERHPRVLLSGAGTPFRTKLTYKETRELESLPREIEALEAEQKALHAKMSEPEYYKQPPEALRADQARHAEIEALLLEKLERWHALESIRG